MPVERLKRFLDDHRVRYLSMRHSPAYTAQEVAAATHIPGKRLAKTVMVKLDGDLAMAVVPATHRVDLERLGQAIGRRVALASENDYRGAFPGCEVGAMPPFGRLWNMEVFADRTLTEDDQIAFLAGTHQEVLILPFPAYQALAEPKILSFATHI